MYAPQFSLVFLLSAALQPIFTMTGAGVSGVEHPARQAGEDSANPECQRLYRLDAGENAASLNELDCGQEESGQSAPLTGGLASRVLGMLQDEGAREAQCFSKSSGLILTFSGADDARHFHLSPALA